MCNFVPLVETKHMVEEIIQILNTVLILFGFTQTYQW